MARDEIDRNQNRVVRAIKFPVLAKASPDPS
jgi:hypothetical protein